MKRWIARPWLWALPALSFFAAPVSAQSITCFGSIIITSLGTEGMTVQVPDGMTVSMTTGSDHAIAPDGTSTVSGPTSIDIKPLSPVKPVEQMPIDNGVDTPGSAGGTPGSAQSGPVDPGVKENTVVEDPDTPITLETPLETPPDSPPVDPPIVTDPLPPTVDDPILTTTVDVPAVPDTTTPEAVQTLDGDPVLDTPEPATLTLLALGGVGALVARRKRRTA